VGKACTCSVHVELLIQCWHSRNDNHRAWDSKKVKAVALESASWTVVIGSESAHERKT
jgi:hypothetical protein